MEILLFVSHIKIIIPGINTVQIIFQNIFYSKFLFLLQLNSNKTLAFFLHAALKRMAVHPPAWLVFCLFSLAIRLFNLIETQT